MKKENEDLEEDNAELLRRLQILEGDLELQSSSSESTVLSSAVLDKILNRLETTPKGMYLRNLAMSLGISSNICLEHVKNLELKKKLSLRYKSDDDYNPLITLTL